MSIDQLKSKRKEAHAKNSKKNQTHASKMNISSDEHFDLVILPSCFLYMSTCYFCYMCAAKRGVFVLQKDRFEILHILEATDRIEGR